MVDFSALKKEAPHRTTMESHNAKLHIYRFGLFELDANSGALRRQGHRVKIQELPFRLLVALLEQPGEVVSRESLRQRLWPENTFVEFDQSFGTAITKLRQALGDEADNPRFVETVPKRGYRFISPVTVVELAQHAAPTVEANSRGPEVIANATGAIEIQNEGTQNAPGVSLNSRRERVIWRGAKLILLSILAIIALSLGGMALWNARSGHAAKVLDPRDTILLADFANHTGDATFDDTLKRALAINLNQSPLLNLLPDHEVEQTLLTMKRPLGESVQGRTALEICQRAGSKVLVSGSLSPLGAKYVIGLDAVDCATGVVFGREQQEVSRKEDILNALGVAGTSLRRRLGESLSTIQRFDVPLQQATTPSLDALKVYSMAWKIRDEKGDAAAIPYVNHAIELDPNFALAYGLLAQIYQQLGEDGLGAAAAQKAYALRDRVTEREFFALTNYYLNFVRGDRERALLNCELWAATYPSDRGPRICLFFDNEMLGRYDRSLGYGLDCVRVDPKTAPCYADLVSNYAVLNRLGEAKDVYRLALSMGLDYPLLHAARYGVAFLESDSAEMARQLSWGSSKPSDDISLKTLEVDSEAFYGSFRRANSLSSLAVDSAIRTGERDQAARLQAFKAFREAAVGSTATARRDANAALKLSTFSFVKGLAGVTLAIAGDTPGAEKIAQSLEANSPDDTMLRGFWLPSIRAAMELQRKNAKKSVEILQVAEPFERGEHVPLLPAYLRGEAYLALGRGEEASKEFQKLIDDRALLQNSTIGSLANLALAEACAMEAEGAGTEKQKWHDRAVASYAEAIKQWEHGDPDMPLLLRAKHELSVHSEALPSAR